MIKRPVFLTLALLPVLYCTAASRPAAEKRIFIYATTDLHEHTGTLARIAAYVRDRRTAYGSVLFFDSGDFCKKGEPAIAETRGEAMAALLAACGYDGCILGNHDSAYGVERMAALIDRYNLPVLAANARWDPSVAPKNVKPYRIFDLDGVRVGVVGTVSQVLTYGPSKSLEIRPVVESLRPLIPQLRREADVVVVLTHGRDMWDEQLAKEVPGIDLILGGHTHKRFTTVVKRDGGITVISKGEPFGAAFREIVIRWGAGGIQTLTVRPVAVTDEMREDESVKKLRARYVSGAKASAPAGTQ